MAELVGRDYYELARERAQTEAALQADPSNVNLQAKKAALDRTIQGDPDIAARQRSAELEARQQAARQKISEIQTGQAQAEKDKKIKRGKLIGFTAGASRATAQYEKIYPSGLNPEDIESQQKTIRQTQSELDAFTSARTSLQSSLEYESKLRSEYDTALQAKQASAFQVQTGTKQGVRNELKTMWGKAGWEQRWVYDIPFVDPVFETRYDPQTEEKVKALSKQLEAEQQKQEEIFAQNPLLNPIDQTKKSYVTEEDVYQLGLRSWGGSITQTIIRNKRSIPTSDKFKYDNLVSFYRSNPGATMEELTKFASEQRGYSRSRGLTGAPGTSLGGGKVIVSTSKHEDQVRAKEEQAKINALGGYTSDIKLDPRIEEMIKRGDYRVTDHGPDKDMFGAPIKKTTKTAAVLQPKQAQVDMMNPTQAQVDMMNPQQYAAYVDSINAYNEKVRKENMDTLTNLKSTISTYKKQGVKEFVIRSDGQIRNVPIDSAYKDILQAPKGASFGPVIGPEIPKGYALVGSLAKPSLIEEPKTTIGPKKQPGFLDGVIAPFYNIGATIYETGRAVKKEIEKPGSGFEFRGAGLPSDAGEKNPFNLPYVKKEMEKKPTATGELLQGKIPAMTEYNVGTIISEIGMYAAPGARIPKPKAKTPLIGTPPGKQPPSILRNQGFDDKPTLTAGFNPPEYRTIKIPDAFVKDAGSVIGAKVPRLPNTERLDQLERIAKIQKKKAEPVQEDPFYDPSQNIPKTRAKEIGTYRVQSDELIGTTANPLKGIFSKAATQSDLSTTGPKVFDVADALKFKEKNPKIFAKKPMGTTPPEDKIGSAGKDDWSSTKIPLGVGLTMVVKKGDKGGISTKPKPPVKPDEPKYKEYKTASGQVLLLREQKQIIKPTQLTKPKLIQKQKLAKPKLIQKQKTKAGIIPGQMIGQPQALAQPQAFKFKQPQLFKSQQKLWQPQALAQPQAFKFKQPQRYRQEETYIFKQPQLFKPQQKLTQPQVFKQKLVFNKLEELKKPKKPKYLIVINKRPPTKKPKKSSGSKADFLASAHIAQITGFRSKADITYGRSRTAKLVSKDITKTTKKFRL